MSSPWNELLPTSLTIGGAEYEIRSDYRAALDILAALSDPELSREDKVLVALTILYPGFEDMPPEHYQEAVEKCYWFIDCGSTETADRKQPRLVDWEQDFQYIVAPINRVTGREIRSVEYMHWWTFIAAYYEIGDCTFAQIVRIRNLKAKGKKLDKQDQEWYRQNRHLVDFKTPYTETEQDMLKQVWGV